MIFELYAPASPLNQFVELFTFYEGLTFNHSIERLFPEGVVEIIIDLTETPKFIYDNTRLTEIQTCKSAWVSGVRNAFISISALPYSSMFVIRFRPGMAYPFLQLPIHELNGQVIDADLIFGNRFGEIREQLLASPSPQGKFVVMERFLSERSKGFTDIPPVVAFGIQQIIQQPTTTQIQQLAEKTGYSHKHFLSLFAKYVGLSPKPFLRVIKFQHTLQSIEQATVPNWSQLALDCGYYDQAHFINDFRAFSGLTPKEYMAQKGDYFNYVPIQ
ncbi:MAG: helix-turn-helix domain-containing protein [Spirosomataceae bacterium]